MGTFGAKLRTIEGGYAFWCPGCEEGHYITGWSFNNDPVNPTFSPSVLVTSGHYMRGWVGPQCYCNQPDKDFAGFGCEQCHSFVENGLIRFLDDCSHALKGKTVPLPDWPTP